jgi:hypothetical protein
MPRQKPAILAGFSHVKGQNLETAFYR